MKRRSCRAPFSACALRVNVMSVVNAITGTAGTDNWLHCSGRASLPLESSFPQHAPSICLYLTGVYVYVLVCICAVVLDSRSFTADVAIEDL